MAILEVKFELKNPARDYGSFHRVLRANSWVKPDDNSYAISSGLEPDQLVQRLRTLIDAGDSLTVTRAKNVTLRGFLRSRKLGEIPAATRKHHRPGATPQVKRSPAALESRPAHASRLPPPQSRP